MKLFSYTLEQPFTPGLFLISPVLYGKNVETYASNQLTSPLLRLPGEIRNQIWRDIFSVGTLQANFNTKSTFATGPDGKWRGDYTPRLAILVVCRQIYAEARLLAFTLNTIAFNSPGALRTLCIEWLSPAQCQAIRKLQYHTEVDKKSEEVRVLRNLPNLEVVLVGEWKYASLFLPSAGV
ncbi:hypothetical protein M011DRAFT_474518 [Sporormia fimetaria CBS 119925]|uniref:Uncharacterized protein n=1 Tax=Sporormia fimetaria CBS 119925 TaxID=1340428 RepID=A0A6A6VKC3_9PLEO|nr:hypothetical protein M011DRAFT_474518 [Sporormia fimetaria CBS 119925]